MVKAKIFYGVIFLLLVSSVLAALSFNPNIEVKANPDQIFVIRFRDAVTDTLLMSIKFEIGSDGRGSAELPTNSEEVNVSIIKIKNKTKYLQPENIISRMEVGTFATNKTISLNIRDGLYNRINPEEETPAENETAEQNETIEEVEEETEKEITGGGEGITGFAILKGKTTTSKIFYSVLGIVVLGVIIFFFIKKGHFSFPAGGEEREPRVTKLSEMTKQSEGKKLDGAEKRLEKAERELRDARNEINTIKNKKSELTEAEEQFKKAKENLEKLEGGGED